MARALVYLTLWAVQVGIVAVMATPAWMSAQIAREKAAVETYLGQARAEDLSTRSDALFRVLLVESGVVGTVERALLPQPGGRMGDRDIPWLFDWIGRSLRTFWFQLYQGIYRLLLLADWVPILGVVLGAAVVDGAVARLISKATHRYANPVRYRTGIRVLIALVVAVLFYLSLPINVSPVVIPVWFFAAAATVIVVMANAQHRI